MNKLQYSENDVRVCVSRERGELVRLKTPSIFGFLKYKLNWTVNFLIPVSKLKERPKEGLFWRGFLPDLTQDWYQINRIVFRSKWELKRWIKENNPPMIKRGDYEDAK